MNVAVVSSHYARPGSFTGEPVHRLSRALVARDLAVRVICPVGRFERQIGLGNLARLSEGGSSYRLDDIDVTYLRYSNVPHRISPHWDVWNLFKSIQSALRPSEHLDVIHAHRLFPTGAAVVRLGQRLGVPTVVTAHGSDVHTHPARNRRVANLTRTVIESADRVVSVSDDLARRIENLGDPRAPVETVCLGVDTQVFRPVSNRLEIRRQLSLPRAGPGFVSVSRISPMKGVFELLDGFRQILTKHPKAWLAIVGDGPAFAELTSRRAKYGLADRVYLPGAVPNDEVADWLRAADVFVLASYAEGLPNVVLEAMACGLPVVATDVGGTREAVSVESGVLVEPRNPTALATALNNLASSPEQRSRLGSEALSRARTYFSWERAAQAYDIVYTSVAGKPSMHRR